LNCPLALVELLGEPEVTEVRDEAVSPEKWENPEELVLEERELHRDCSERGEAERTGIENGVNIGVVHSISSLSRWKSCSSSSLSSSTSCCANVLPVIRDR
jgi:hypothetical protein